MSEVDKHLDSLLEIESETITADRVEEVTTSVVTVQEGELLPVPAAEEEPTSERDLEYDYELSRETHRELLEQGKVALERLMEVANESQHPRAYEVAGQLLKNLSDMTDKLMILHEKKKKIETDGNSKKSAGNVNVDKAVFVGTTAELLKRVKHESDE